MPFGHKILVSMQTVTSMYSTVLFPKGCALGGEKINCVNPMTGKGSTARRTLSSLLFVMWLLGTMFVALLFLGSLDWDRRFGHPPYAIWGFTAAYAVLGGVFFRGSHRSAKMFQPHIDKLKAAGFAPELELLSAECYAGFSRAQDKIITLDNVQNVVTELSLSDVDKVEIPPRTNHNGFVIINLLTRRLELPLVCLKVQPAQLANWKARLRVVLNLD